MDILLEVRRRKDRGVIEDSISGSVVRFNSRSLCTVVRRGFQWAAPENSKGGSLNSRYLDDPGGLLGNRSACLGVFQGSLGIPFRVEVR